MNLSEPFIRRPIATSLVTLALLIFGALGYFSLPVSDLPNVDYPTLSVSASLPGASPQTMAAVVAAPLERQFSTIPGVDSMTSESGAGTTRITLQFRLDRDIDAAAQDVQTAISAATRQLPPDMPAPPALRKVNPADAPILYFGVSSTAMPLYEVHDWAERGLAQRLSGLPGVAQVHLWGGQKYAVRIQVNPTLLASHGLGLDEVRTAIRQANSQAPTGTLHGPDRALQIETDAQLQDADGFREVIVAYRNGAPVVLGELGTVRDAAENERVASWIGGERSIMLAIQRQPGANTVAVASAIEETVSEVRAQLPAGVRVEPIFNRADGIRAAVRDVQLTLLVTLALVVGVIFVFLRSAIATLIPALVLPVAFIGTFAAMALGGFSLNNLTLLALTLSVGFVIDDAVVMLESASRAMEKGADRLTAALQAARELSFTVVASSLALAVLFVPLLLMSGLVGRLFQEFALTIIFAVLISGAVSITLTPMLCARFLKPADVNRPPGRVDRGFAAASRAYEGLLDRALSHRRLTVGIAAGLLVLAGGLFMVVPKGFLPSEDTGQLIGNIQAVEGTAFEGMLRHREAIVKVLDQDPAIATYSLSVGAGGLSSTVNSGSIFIRLKPRDQREASADQVVQRLQRPLSGLVGVRVVLQNPPPIRLGGRVSRGLYQVSLEGADPATLYPAVGVLEARLRAEPALADVNSDLQIAAPQVRLSLDRQAAARLGITVEQVEQALGAGFGGAEVTRIYTPSSDYPVIMEVMPAFQQGPASLGQLHVRSASGALVPLSALARFSEGLGPTTVSHAGQSPAVTLSFNLGPGASLGEATAAVARAAEETLPVGVTHRFVGSAAAFQESLASLGFLLVIALVVIYIVLGILYESYLHPLTILAALPAAGVGALGILWLMNRDLDVYALVGVVLLIGIVKKNAIILIDFALRLEHEEGRDPESAMREACRVRFRPILMTALATLMGALPVAIGWGQGAEARQPLGLAVTGGLLVSLGLTLVLTPVVHVALRRRFSRRLNVTMLPAEGAATPTGPA